MSNQTPEVQNAAPARFQCRHIFLDGHRCGSICLKQEYFCYYHHHTRKPVADLRARRQFQSDAEARESAVQATFDMPEPDCRVAIQHGIGEILRRVAQNTLDPRRAGLLLYGLQCATQLLPRELSFEERRTEQQDLQETVPEFVDDATHGTIAPIANLEDHPQLRQKTLGELLLDDWNRKPAPCPACEARGLRDAQPTINLQAAADPEPSPAANPSARPRKSTLNSHRLNTLHRFRGRGWGTHRKTKKPTPKGGSFRYYAGDHLISHTLTRAVPSAQRGLTSVFGMGTGVTLAVNSPANRGAWREFHSRSRVLSACAQDLPLHLLLVKASLSRSFTTE